jgi:hypothetical protein
VKRHQPRKGQETYWASWIVDTTPLFQYSPPIAFGGASIAKPTANGWAKGKHGAFIF